MDEGQHQFRRRLLQRISELLCRRPIMHDYKAWLIIMPSWAGVHLQAELIRQGHKLLQDKIIRTHSSPYLRPLSLYTVLAILCSRTLLQAEATKFELSCQRLLNISNINTNRLKRGYLRRWCRPYKLGNIWESKLIPSLTPSTRYRTLTCQESTMTLLLSRNSICRVQRVSNLYRNSPRT